MHFEPASAQEVAALIRRAAEANDAFLNGDMERWYDILPLSPDFSIMTPMGGWSANGFDTSPDRLADMARTFTSAKTDLEVVATYASADMVVLAAVERQTAVVGGLPPQDWSLRITLVFRRNGKDWDLVHRHADPLVKRISLEKSAKLARGEVSLLADHS
jgi:ketosteroid isomerase-like protein